jgi:transcription antitermination factor NusG
MSKRSFDSFAFQRDGAPDSLYEQPHWYACQTRSRHEKVVDEMLRRQRIESYLPVVRVNRQWKDRRKQVSFPLFPGYVFARFTLHELIRVVSTHGVGRVVSARGYPTPIPAGEIENVRRVSSGVVASGAEVETGPALHEGDWIRVAAGPFEGVEGVVVERRGRRRVLVGIAAIGQGLEVDIDVADLTPIPRPVNAFRLAAN